MLNTAMTIVSITLFLHLEGELRTNLDNERLGMRSPAHSKANGFDLVLWCPLSLNDQSSKNN